MERRVSTLPEIQFMEQEGKEVAKHLCYKLGKEFIKVLTFDHCEGFIVTENIYDSRLLKRLCS